MKLLSVLPFVGFVIIFSSCSGNGDGKSIELTGTIDAKYVSVSSKVAGEITDIIFDEGSIIAKGDTIIKIDDETYRLQYEKAKALVDNAKAQLELLKNGARYEDIRQAKSALDQAKIQFTNGRKDSIRMTKLLKAKTITEKQYDDIIAKYRIAKAQLSAAKANYAKINNLARPEDYKKAEASLSLALANEKLAAKNLNDCYVISPQKGYLVEIYFEKGETVHQMSTLFDIANLENVELDVYVNELDLPKVKLNQRANVYIDAYPDKSYHGKVIYISPEAEFTPKNIQTKDERTRLVFKVTIAIDNPNLELKKGMPADAEIIID